MRPIRHSDGVIMINKNICNSGKHCKTCMLNAYDFRTKAQDYFTEWDGACPEGYFKAGEIVKEPDLITKAKTLGKAAVKAVKAPKVKAAPHLVAEREAICAKCPMMENGKCLKCGCSLKYKQKLETESCPIGNW